MDWDELRIKTMGLFTEPFPQAKETWNLENLVQDLTKAKQQYCGKRKKLTPVEIACKFSKFRNQEIQYFPMC